MRHHSRITAFLLALGLTFTLVTPVVGETPEEDSAPQEIVTEEYSEPTVQEEENNDTAADTPAAVEEPAEEETVEEKPVVQEPSGEEPTEEPAETDSENGEASAAQETSDTTEETVQENSENGENLPDIPVEASSDTDEEAAEEEELSEEELLFLMSGEAGIMLLAEPSEEDEFVFEPLTVGGIVVDTSADDTESGWKDGSGWKYFAGKYLYLYNCSLTEIEVNGVDLTVFAEGVNQIGTISSDKKVSFFGNGITMVDALNMFEGSLKLDSDSAPALFLKTGTKTYTLQNSAAAAGKIYGSHTLPGGNTYLIPSNTSLKLCMNGRKGSSLTVPQGAALEVSGRLTIEGVGQAESTNSDDLIGFDGLASFAGSNTIVDPPQHSVLCVEGSCSIKNGATVNMSGSITLRSGILNCSTAIIADAGTEKGSIFVYGNCSSSTVSIQGGFVVLKENCTLGTLSSTGNAILCQSGPYSSTVKNLKRPGGGTLEIHGYRHLKTMDTDRRVTGIATLYVTGDIEGGAESTYQFHDMFLYLSNTSNANIQMISGFLLQMNGQVGMRYSNGSSAVSFWQGYPAANGSKVPMSTATLVSSPSSDYGYTTSAGSTWHSATKIDLSGKLSGGKYEIGKLDFESGLAEEGDILTSGVFVIGYDLLGDLKGEYLTDWDSTTFKSIIWVIVDSQRNNKGGTGESNSSDTSTNTGGSTLGGSDQGNSSSTGTETTLNTGSTYTFRIVASAGEGGSISPTGSTNISSGGSQTYTITPATGYEIDTLKVNGAAVTAAGSYSFTKVNANGTIRVTFRKKTMSVTKSVTGSGSISGPASVEYGGSGTYTFTPGTGYEVKEVLVNGKSVGAPASYTLQSVTASATISATFQKKTYPVTVSKVTGGSISGPTSVTHGDSATYTVTLQEGYEVTSLTIGSTNYGAVNSATATITGAVTVTATLRLKTMNITLQQSTGGTITGSTTAEYGSGKTYTFTPDEGWEVADIQVNGVSVGAGETYTVSTIKSSTTISATFRKKTYTVTVSKVDGGSISGPTSVTHGDSATYTVTPQEGYEITSLTIGSTNYGAVYSATATITGPVTVTAQLRLKTYSVSIPTVVGGEINGPSSVVHGSTVTYTLTPNEGYEIVDFTVNGVSAGTADSASTVAKGTVTLSAELRLKTYTMTATAGEGGSITGPDSSKHFGTPAYVIVPDVGYEIADVKVDGASVGAVSQYRFTSISGGHTISAEFSKLTYTITASAGRYGSITPNGDTVAEYGSSLTYTIRPQNGYLIDTVTVDGTKVGRISEYTFSNITEGHTISATFTEEPIESVTILSTAGAGGTIAPAGEVEFAIGSEGTFTITPDAGYAVADVKVDGVSVGAVSSYTFTGLIKDCEISVEFRLLGSFSVTVNETAGGTASMEGTADVTEGDTVVMYFTPEEGYEIADVLVNGVSVGSVDTLSLVVTENLEIEVAYREAGSGLTDGTDTETAANGAETTATTELAGIGDEGAFYEIALKAGKGGSIRCANDEDPKNMAAGSLLTVKITPDKGYEIADVLVDGKSVGAVAEYTLKNIEEDHTVEAVFKENKSGQTFLWAGVVVALLLAGVVTAAVVTLKKKKH